MTFSHRSSCRLCNSSSLSLIYDIPPSQPVDGFRSFAHEKLSLPLYPMDLYICGSCGHVQLLDVVDPSILYGEYIYTSSSSPDLLQHFTEYSSYIQSLALSSDYSFESLLDVGCNDGLLLSLCSTFNLRVGIDPAPNISSTSSDHILINDYLTRESVHSILSANNGKYYDVITANNVFAHADSLSSLLSCISDLLSENGYFIFEVSYLVDLLENSVVDYVYHEHLCYHSIKPLVPFLRSCGLYITDIKRIPTKGGSIRVTASKHSFLENSSLISSFIAYEVSIGCYSPSSYPNTKNRLSLISSQLLSHIQVSSSPHIFCYGACPTSIVNSLLLNYHRFISAFLDDNPIRQYSLAPNTFVPVLPPSCLSEYTNPVVVIGAWRFSDLIVPKVKHANPDASILIPDLTTGLRLL